MGSSRVFFTRRLASSPPSVRATIKAMFNMWTYLKHQPEEEHHSNAGNNICMVLDDKLMAQHRRVFVRLFPDPHVDVVRKKRRFARRGGELLSSR